MGTSERIAWCCEDEDIKYVQTINRKPLEQRWSAEKLLEVDQAPWSPKTASKKESDLRVPVNIGDLDRPDVRRRRNMTENQKEYKVKHVYLLRVIC